MTYGAVLRSSADSLLSLQGAQRLSTAIANDNSVATMAIGLISSVATSADRNFASTAVNINTVAMSAAIATSLRVICPRAWALHHQQPQRASPLLYKRYAWRPPKRRRKSWPARSRLRLNGHQSSSRAWRHLPHCCPALSNNNPLLS